MTEQKFAQKRQFYRLKYPKRAMPVLQLGNQRYRVTELSEQGIRVLMENYSTMLKGEQMTGKVSLPTDDEISIEGAVLRFDGEEVIFKLSKGPSFKIMVQEQRNIKNKFPHFYSLLRAQVVM